MITSQELRQKFLDFMATKGHAIIPSASLIPKEDPTLLFVNSGMYPLVPYLMGQKHPAGVRLADSQKVIRTVDIDEVGDNRHLSFFEMLGSWSLGDYSKTDSITWGFEFLTDPMWLGLDPRRLFVTVYKGFGDVGPDIEAIETWQKCFASVGITADVGVEYDFKTGQKATGNEKYIYLAVRFIIFTITTRLPLKKTLTTWTSYRLKTLSRTKSWKSGTMSLWNTKENGETILSQPISNRLHKKTLIQGWVLKDF
jgi:tRNA synthetases class II (A)